MQNGQYENIIKLKIARKVTLKEMDTKVRQVYLFNVKGVALKPTVPTSNYFRKKNKNH